MAGVQGAQPRVDIRRAQQPITAGSLYQEVTRRYGRGVQSFGGWSFFWCDGFLLMSSRREGGPRRHVHTRHACCQVVDVSLKYSLRVLCLLWKDEFCIHPGTCVWEGWPRQDEGQVEKSRCSGVEDECVVVSFCWRCDLMRPVALKRAPVAKLLRCRTLLVFLLCVYFCV